MGFQEFLDLYMTMIDTHIQLENDKLKVMLFESDSINTTEKMIDMELAKNKKLYLKEIENAKVYFEHIKVFEKRDPESEDICNLSDQFMTRLNEFVEEPTDIEDILLSKHLNYVREVLGKRQYDEDDYKFILASEVYHCNKGIAALLETENVFPFTQFTEKVLVTEKDRFQVAYKKVYRSYEC